MNDQYDYYCMETLGKVSPQTGDPYEADNVQCACAEYLRAEGYETLSNYLTRKRVMASAAQLLLTTTNTTDKTQKGE